MPKEKENFKKVETTPGWAQKTVTSWSGPSVGPLGVIFRPEIGNTCGNHML